MLFKYEVLYKDNKIQIRILVYVYFNVLYRLFNRFLKYRIFYILVRIEEEIRFKKFDKKINYF